MNHPSFSVFLQLFDYVFGNNFDIKHFLYLCKSPPNSDIETQNNWKRYSFQLIEALSARNEKELSLRYAFLNGERSEVSFIDDLATSFEMKLNFFIRSFPKKIVVWLAFSQELSKHLIYLVSMLIKKVKYRLFIIHFWSCKIQNLH